MRNVLSAGLALGLAAGSFLGCASPYETGAPTPESSTTAAPHPDTVAQQPAPTPHGEALMNPAGDSIRDLFQADAPINVIYIPTPEPIQDESDQETIAAITDNTVATSMLGYMSVASSGRYEPSSATTVVTKPLETNGCLSSRDTEQFMTIQDHAQQYTADGALNIAVVGASPCVSENGTEGDAGYTSDGYLPILTLRSFNSIAQVALHEAGHSGSLEHTSSLTCTDPAQAASCEVLSGDPLSVMYSIKPDSRLTTPELDALGLLNSSEVLFNPPEGSIILTSPEIDTTSPKALALATPEGTIYITWERDPTASKDEVCEAYDYTDPEQLVEGAEIKSKYNESGESEIAVCQTIAARPIQHSLQVRRFQNGEFSLITRPDRVEDAFKEPAIGEVNPGATVYEGSGYRMVLEAFHPQGSASIRVEKS